MREVALVLYYRGECLLVLQIGPRDQRTAREILDDYAREHNLRRLELVGMWYPLVRLEDQPTLQQERTQP